MNSSHACAPETVAPRRLGAVNAAVAAGGQRYDAVVMTQVPQ